MGEWTSQDEAELQALEAEFGGGRPGISDSLLDAVAWQESRHNPKAISPAGAQGMYQFMPATAQEVRQELGMSSPYDYTNAGEQRQMAAHYLGKMQQQFGSPELALAAYNAGPGNVGKAIRAAGEGAEWDQIAQYLPAETQAYVPSVLKKKDTTMGRPAQSWTPEMEAELQALESEFGSGDSSGTSGSEVSIAQPQDDGRSGLSMLLSGDFSGFSKRYDRAKAMSGDERAEQVLDRPSARSILGAAATAADIPSWGFADEGVGLLAGDKAKQIIRDTKDEYFEKNPVTGSAIMLASALKSPAAFKKATSMLGSAAKSAIGAGTYALGDAEGYLGDRAGNAVEGAGVGALTDVLLRGTGKALKGLRQPAKSLSRAAKTSALGITKSDRTKMIKGKSAEYEYLKNRVQPIDSALDVAEQQGVVSKKLLDNSPEQIYFRNNEKIDDLGKQINGLVKEADNALKGATPTGKLAAPKFDNTEKLLKGGDLIGEMDNATEFYNTLKNDFAKIFDGSFESLQTAKVALNKKAYKSLTSTAARTEVHKAFTRDIKELLENEIENLVKKGKLTKEAAGKLKKLNDTQGKLLELNDIFKREAVGEESQDLVKKIKPILRTSGGYGSLALLLGGLPGALFGFGGGAMLGSAPGRMLQSRAIDKAIPALGAGGKALDTQQDTLIRALLGASNQ